MDRQCRAYHMRNVTRHCCEAVRSGVGCTPHHALSLCLCLGGVALALPVEGGTEKHGPVKGPVDPDAHNGSLSSFRYICCLCATSFAGPHLWHEITVVRVMAAGSG